MGVMLVGASDTRSAHRSMETKMRTRVLTIAGVLLVVGSVSQIEAAAARSLQTATRALHPINQRLRDSVGPRPEHQRASAPVAADNKSCDRFWCY